MNTMLSIDTNLLFMASNPLDKHQHSAQAVLMAWIKREDVVISELVLLSRINQTFFGS